MPPVNTCDLLLTHAVLVTMDDDRRIVHDGALAVRGEHIAAVGTTAELSDWTAARRVDCSGKAVIPGLIDCHNHLFQLLGRGLGEGMALWPWLCEFIWPYAGGITRDEAVASVRLASVEAALAGTTCVIDNHYAPADPETTLAVAEAIERTGLRGSVARGITGTMTEVAAEHGLSPALFRHSADEEIAITEQCLRERTGHRVGVWPAPLNIIYVDQDLVGRSVELARTHGTPWHSHCSEARVDPEIYQQAYGTRPFLWLRDAGLLDERATLAHAIWLDDEEIEAVGTARSGLSYNPMSNQYLASGTMRLRDVRTAGAVVGLGSDGSAGHRMDMFQVMKQAIYVQRLTTLEPDSTNAMEALTLATREGARYAGIDAGQLTPGTLADLAVINLDAPPPRPPPRHRLHPRLLRHRRRRRTDRRRRARHHRARSVHGGRRGGDHGRSRGAGKGVGGAVGAGAGVSGLTVWVVKVYRVSCSSLAQKT
ncbi:amidohydrolase family protein [Streptomyces sp. NPDC058045]|uniref:amidohydrolase family protein n=1 Tax=Streptomyces sp. NPDC058045 TaxID=3346311 RepID=UPI0036E186A6